MDEFVYVKPVEGHLVPRYSTLRSSATTFIGAVRDGKTLKWTVDAVVRIPRAEWTRYLKEYQRALAEGSLKKASEADFGDWMKKHEQIEKEADDARNATNAKPEEVAVESDPETEPPAPTGDKKTSKKSSKSDEGAAR